MKELPGLSFQKGGATAWVDAIGSKKIEFKNSEIEDFIILKNDGFPTYHLASVVDDHLMQITHVIRGDDWIPSTPKHIMLYNALGWEIPVFAHVPNIIGVDGKKLSKRRGAKSVLDFKDGGFLPHALLNYLMLLGWSPKNDKEILSKDEIIKEFSLEKINSSPATFDERKLLWMNGEYIRKTSDSELKTQILKNDPKISSIQNFEQYIPFAKSRMKTLADFRNLVENDADVSLNPKQKELAQALIEKYKDIEWNPNLISTATIKVRDQFGASTKDVYTVLTGKPQGLPFEEKLGIEGRKRTLEWLGEVVKKNE